MNRFVKFSIAMLLSLLMGSGFVKAAFTIFGHNKLLSSVSVVGLHVSGNKILNGSNQVVPFRGINQDGTEYQCLAGSVFDGPIDQPSIDAKLAWAINIVRLPINEQCWLGINGLPSGLSSSTYQTDIINYVNLLTSQNIAVIFDLQWAAPGTTQATMLTPMPDMDHAPAFWTSAANAFKSNSSVIFDLFNEPFPDSNADTTAAWTCLSVGGTCPGVSYTAASMQSLINAIRATGATNVIMVPGVQFTNSLSQWLTYKPTDTANNLVASWHSYAANSCNTLTCWNSQIAPVIASVPLITGEIGENDCQGTYIDVLMPWLDMTNSGYLGWAWNTYNCSSFPALVSDYAGTPTGFGIDFRNHLLTLAGRPIPTPPVIPFFAPQLTGTWVNVTPSGATPGATLGCGNFGAITVGADPRNQSNIYTHYDCQGVWKSTDYGATWTGPINTGTNGAAAGDCAGGITLADGGAGNPPIIYEACIRAGSTSGASLGIWKSTNGGVDWTLLNISVAPSGRQDVYPVSVDPYDPNHLLVPAHELDMLYESFNGGSTWQILSINSGMIQSGGTGLLFFINTGVASTTKTTFLWLAQFDGSNIGTWRTTNDGSTWTKIDGVEHPHGDGQIYQPNTTGTVYRAGINTTSGVNGVSVSTDYGVTWTNIGANVSAAVVWGTPNALYSEYSWACGCPVDPGFEFQIPPTGSTWASLSTPTGMGNGPAQTVTVFDGTNYVTIGANWQVGNWRYVEDSFGVNVGSMSAYTASGQPDWTIYYPDVANAAMTVDSSFFTPFTTGASITGTPDPTLYATGKYGVFGTWVINVPNGNYKVTLGIAPVDVYTGTNPNAGQFGQDQNIQSVTVGNCIWSSDAGCQGSVAPAVDAAGTVTYSVSIFNQMMLIQPSASNGGGRKTMLNTIKVTRVP